MRLSGFLLPMVCVLWVGAAKGQSLLVVNQGDATVSVVDPVKEEQVATIDEKVTGVHGHEVVTATDGKTAFVPIYGSVGVGKPGIDGHEMLVVDVPSRKIVEHVDFGHGVRPHLPVLDAKRQLLYVTTELDESVTVLDAKTHKVLGSVPTGQEQSHMLVLSHDGRLGYTANVGPGSVSVLDMVRKKTVKVIPVSGMVQRISISNDDKRVFTSDETKPRLVVIDTAKNEVAGSVELPGLGYGTAPTPDGKWLLVAVPSMDEVAVVDLAAMKVARTIKVGSKPQEVLIRPDGKVAYVSCMVENGTVDAIDLTKWEVRKSIKVGPRPDGLGWGL